MAYTDVSATVPKKSVHYRGEDFTAKRVVRLDPSTDLVAVTWMQKRTPNNSLSIRITIWLVDANGEAILNLDVNGEAVLVDFKQNIVGSVLATFTAQQAIKRIAGVMIGEPMPSGSPIQYPPDVLEEINIRNAITTARAGSGDIEVTF
jgi:hypothetical protein